MDNPWNKPGKALKDADGNYMCIPMENGQLIVLDTPAVRAQAYPISKQALDKAPNGVHAFIRVTVD